MRLNQVSEQRSFDMDDARIFINMRIKPDDFAPVLSADNVDLHFNTLTKNYFKKWNEEPSDFSFCGAALHSIWWAGLAKEPVDVPKAVEEFLQPLGLSADSLSEKLISRLSDLQGNGWFYLDRNGELQTIENHRFTGDFNDILVLIDMWEHSYLLDYKADKQAYIKQIVTLIDWKEVGKRLANPKYTETVLRIKR